MNAVDTNVLIFAHDDRDPQKKATAQLLIQTMTNGALPWQVICEYLSASRKLVPFGYSRAQAWSDLRKLSQLWRVLIPDWRVIDRVEVIAQTFSLSIWDSLLVSACLEGGVTRLYSEDITGYARIDTLELVNPF
jgi:predicted nucleic acid-binding protein